jgi:hypothetical protein
MPLEIDQTSLGELAKIITQVCASMRKSVLEDEYSEQEKDIREQSLTEIKTAVTWTLHYIEYYRELKRQDPTLLLEDIANLLELERTAGKDSEYFSGGTQLVNHIRKQNDQVESAGE